MRGIAFGALAAFLALAAAAAPVFAVSPGNTYSLSRTNSGGTSFANMASSQTAFCFLTKVSVTETDTNEEKATCRITRGPLVWTLEAIMGTSSDADVECAAHCYNN